MKELREFKEALQVRLEALEEPVSLDCQDVSCQDHRHSQERDSYVVDVVSAWVEAGYTTIPVVRPPCHAAPGKKQKRARLPGWEDHCEPLCGKAKFWYAVWLSAGRPTTGELHRLMVCTRLKYRAAVRRVRKEASSAKAHVLLEAARSGTRHYY